MKSLITDSKRAYRENKLGFIFQLSLIAVTAWAMGTGIAHMIAGLYIHAIGVILGLITIICWDKIVKRQLKALRIKEEDAKHRATD